MIDSNTLITITTIVITVIAIIITIILESRKIRREKLQDALMNKILPFYGLLLEIMIQIDLLISKGIKIELEKLKIPVKKLYEMIANSFIYIQDINLQQLLVNTLKIAELINIEESKLKNKKKPMDSKYSDLLVNFYGILELIRGILDSYLRKYSKSFKLQITTTLDKDLIATTYNDFLETYFNEKKEK